MTKIVFKCLRCGRCCKNLFREIEEGLFGLNVFPDEKELFPKKFVSPYIGIGWGTSGPKYVVSYQLNINVCVHLSKDNLCKVYDKRPLACQAFPLLSAGPFGTSIPDPNECTFVEKVEKEAGSLNNLFPITPKKFRAPQGWQAVRKINNRVEKSYTSHLMDARVLWRFDLKNKEWQIASAF